LTIIICTIVGSAVGYVINSIGMGVVIGVVIGMIIGNVLQRKSIKTLDSYDFLTEEDKRKIFHHNAVKFLGLDGKGVN